MKKLLASLFAFLPALVAAGTLTYTAVPPTTYTDGTAIVATGPEALVSLRFEYGTCAGLAFGTKINEATVLLPATVTTFSGVVAGDYCGRAFAKLVNGTESAASVTVSKTILSRVPMAPALTAAAGVAYTIIKQVDKLVMLPVGTVPGSTPCDPAQSVNGYNVVPRAAVTWAGNVQPDVVVAQCS